GLAWLFCFDKESFLLIKVLNEMVSTDACVEVVLSPGGDYAGVLLQGNTKAWLEIYRLPKDSWLKETEEHPGAAAGLACGEKRSSQTSHSSQANVFLWQESSVSAKRAEAKLTPPVLLLKVKPPRPLTGSSFKSPLDALKKVSDGSMLGLGYNHLIKDSQWEQQEAIFHRTYQEYLEAEGERERARRRSPGLSNGVLMFCIVPFFVPNLLLSSVIPFSIPDVPAGISVHWDGSHNLCLYLLNHPLKEKVDSDPNPDVVWPCAAPMACSTVSSCFRYLALACEDTAVTIWDKHPG
ncbi:WDR93 protein, partial [Atlantisia rogersi]|nr:WDR93 protein [Atlantisia rogersi]